MNEKELMQLKTRIDEAKSSASRLEGQRDQLMETLKKEWKCKDISEAQKKLNSLEKDIEKLSESIQEGLDDLDEKMAGNE